MHKFRSKELNKIISFNLSKNFTSFVSDADSVSDDIANLDLVPFKIKLPVSAVSIVLLMNDSGEILSVYPKVYMQEYLEITVDTGLDEFILYVVSKDHDDGFVTKTTEMTVNANDVQSGDIIEFQQYGLSSAETDKHKFDPATLFDTPIIDLSSMHKRKLVPDYNDETQWYPYVGAYAGGTLQWETQRDYEFLKNFFILIKKRYVLTQLQAAWTYTQSNMPVDRVTENYMHRIKKNATDYDDVGSIFDYTLPYWWGARARKYILTLIEALNRYSLKHHRLTVVNPSGDTSTLLHKIELINGDIDVLSKIGELLPTSWDAHRASRSHELMEMYALNLFPILYRRDNFMHEHYSDELRYSYSDVSEPKCFLYPHNHADVPKEWDDHEIDVCKKAAHRTAYHRTFITRRSQYKTHLQDAGDEHFNEYGIDADFFEDYRNDGGADYTRYKHPGWLLSYAPTVKFWTLLHSIPLISLDPDKDVSRVSKNHWFSGRFNEAAASYSSTRAYYWSKVVKLSQDILDLNDQPMVAHSQLTPDDPEYAWGAFWQKARDIAIRSLEIRDVINDAIENIDIEYASFQTDIVRGVDNE